MPTEVWVATAAIDLANVRAYNVNYIVPDSVVTRFNLEAQGLVERMTIPDSPAPVNGVNPVTQREFDEALENLLDQTAGDARYLTKSGGALTGDLDVSGRLKATGFALPLTFPSTKRPWRDSTWRELLQAGHGWTTGGTGTASSNLNDTSEFVKGSQSARVTTAGNAGQSQFQRLGMPAVDMTGKMLRLTFKVDDVANLDYIYFYLGSGSLANYFRWTVHTHSTTQNWVQSGEWVTVTLPWGNVMNATGTYTLDASKRPSITTGFTDMRVAVFDKGAGPVTYRVQSIEVVPDDTTDYPKGVISITFDDSWDSVYDYARPKMDSLGFRGTQYTIADYIGTSNHLTMPELRTLHDFSGWEVSGHAYTGAAHGARYTTLTTRQVEDELRNLRAWLVTNGFGGDSFAYPGGQFSRTTDGTPIESLVSRYFGSGRSIISENFETSSAPMPYRLRSMTGITDVAGIGGVTVASMTAAGGALDRVERGTWLILCLHQVITGTPTDATQISRTGFEQLMDAIAARGIPVLPVGDVLRGY